MTTAAAHSRKPPLGLLPQALGLLLLLLPAVGCTTQGLPRQSAKSLVAEDAPVFDKRFQGLSREDLDLQHLWIEEDPEGRENVPIHNNTLADLTARVKDGVVNIYTLRLEQKEAKFGISPRDLLPIKIPLVSDLLEIIPFQVPIPYKDEGLSLGSGFVIHEQGYILTNAHVVFNATDIRVLLSEGRIEYPATIIGLDRLTDTALIKIEPGHPLTVLPLGDSDRLRTGEMVLAVGNPLGFRHTVTSGIVSATERLTPGLNAPYMDFIQTDSAINPGSSGGPLINLHGEVVGINTAILSAAQLMGFAIPINTLKEVLPLLVLGKTERGWFGVEAVPLGAGEALELGFAGEGGILVLKVEEGSPAQASGLRPRDIIVELDDRSMDNFLAFRRRLLGLGPGREVRLLVFREGQSLALSARLAERPSEE